MLLPFFPLITSLYIDHCIVYFSTWQKQFPPEDLAAILEQSRINNRKANVTGVTLYVQGNIVQVLEGKQPTLEALYQRIEADERHTNLLKVFDRPIAQRLFADYVMGYQTITSRQLEEIRNVVDLDTQEEILVKSEDPIVLRTIKVFYQSNQYN